MRVVARAPGLNLSLLQATFGISQAEAKNLIGGNAGVLGAVFTAPEQTTRSNTTLETVAADSAGLSALTEARDRMIANATAKTGD
jgi:hypothetical protein